MARPGRWASKDWSLFAPVEVLDVLPGWKFKVKWEDTWAELVGYRAWRMKKNGIAIMVGDWVKIEINEYDFSQWRIVFRYRDRNDALRDYNEAMGITPPQPEKPRTYWSRPGWSQRSRRPGWPNSWPKRGWWAQRPNRFTKRR